MIHQPLGGFQGQATDIDIHAKEILRMRDSLNELLVKHTGQPVERIKNDTERDYFMSAGRGQGVRAHRRGPDPARRRARPAPTSARVSGLRRACYDCEEPCRRESATTTQANLTCSFCGKIQKEVKKLIAGPTVYICDECIGLCNDIIAEEIEKEEPGLRLRRRSRSRPRSRRSSTST